MSPTETNSEDISLSFYSSFIDCLKFLTAPQLPVGRNGAEFVCGFSNNFILSAVPSGLSVKNGGCHCMDKYEIRFERSGSFAKFVFNGQIAESPSTLGSCEHYFCRSCIEDAEVSNCPDCELPFLPKDVQLNRQLATAVSLCYQLDSLLNFDDGAQTLTPPSTEDEKPQPATPSPKSGKIAKDVYDFDAEAKSPSPPALCQRTRRATKQKKKQDFLAQTNTSWAIGKESKDTDKCSSCHRTNNKKVCFNKGNGCRVEFQEALRSDIQECKEASGSDVQESAVNKKKKRKPRDKKGKKKGKITKEDHSADEPAQKTPANKTVAASSPRPGPSQAWMSPAQIPTGGDQHTSTSPKPRSRSRSPVTPQPVVKAIRKVQGSDPVASPLQTPPRRKGLLGEPGFFTPKSSTPGSASRRAVGGSPGFSKGSPAHAKRNAKGETPLHVAVIKGDQNKIERLLEEGADVNAKDHAGWTPLHEACNHGFTKIAELLLDHSALINMPGLDNDTPLHDAISNNRVDCVRMLVSRGASLTIRNLRGETACDIAQSDEMKEAIKTPVIPDQLDKTLTQTSAGLDHRPPVLLTTGLNREQQSKVQACARLLHGKLAQKFSNEVSHLVTGVNDAGSCPRTLKFMEAVLRGVWVVNLDWVETCLEYKEQVSEEPFEVPGCSSSPDSQAPSRSRQNNLQQLPGLFEGCHFYFHGTFDYPNPSREELAHLVKTGGGTVLKREHRIEPIDQSELTIPYHAREGSQLANCSFYVISASDNTAQLHGKHGCHTSVKWLKDCIADFRLNDLPVVSE